MAATNLQAFKLIAMVLDMRFEISAQLVGGAYRITSTTGSTSARSLGDALAVARKTMGMFLQAGERADGAWGLYAEADGIRASYGRPPVPLGPAAPPTGRLTEIDKIYRRWHFADGPRGALNNALELIHYVARGSHAYAA